MEKPILAAMLSCQGTRLTDEEKHLFETYNPLGVSLFNRNMQNKKQVAALVAEIKNVINRDDVLIAIDQEGGRVSRLDGISDKRYASAEVLGGVDVKYSIYHADLIASEMRKLGINVNYAPVVDKKNSRSGNVLEGRGFSNRKNAITQRALAMGKEYINQGICPCIKHLPGHFSSTKDPHLTAFSTALSIQKIEQEVNYQRNFKDFPLAMTSHIILKSYDAVQPVTMSQAAVNKLLRSYLGYDGFILSDAIDMYALSGGVSERANKILEAGLDAVCYCSGKIEELYEICSQKRFLTEKSLIRFAKIKKVIHNTPQQVDIKHVETLYMQGVGDKLNIKYSYDATEVLHKMQKKGEKV